MTRAAKDTEQELSNYLCVVPDKIIALVSLCYVFFFQGHYNGLKHNLIFYIYYKTNYIQKCTKK